MAATNMAGPVPSPAGQNISAGSAVIMSPFSGPKGSPFCDVTAGLLNSTGALNTGIGFGSNRVQGLTAPASIVASGFNDDYIPGITFYIPSSASAQTATTAILTCIGGGKSTANVDGNAPTVPYNAQPLLGFGAGGSRDAGAGPAFTGFSTKMVTATGSVANGAAIEAGFLNRVSDGTQLVPAGTAVTMTTGQSSFGSSTIASSAVS